MEEEGLVVEVASVVGGQKLLTNLSQYLRGALVFQCHFHVFQAPSLQG